MIKEINFDRLAFLCEPYISDKKPNILLVRLVSNALSFSDHGLCTIYEIQSGEKTLGAACRYGGAITIFPFGKLDMDELCSFLSVAPITSIECTANLGRKIARKLDMKRVNGRSFYNEKPKNYLEYKAYETQNVSVFFDVLKAADPYYKDISYEEYYCDVFYRQKLPARLFLAEFSGKNAATAAIMHEYKKVSIISDVAVLGDFRRRGLASSITAKVSEILISEGKIPTLMCTERCVQKLYKKIGFKPEKKFSMLYFKK